MVAAVRRKKELEAILAEFGVRKPETVRVLRVDGRICHGTPYTLEIAD